MAEATPAAEPKPQLKSERVKTRRVTEKIDPEMVAKARELRDRYLEHVNSEAHACGRQPIHKSRLCKAAAGRQHAAGKRN